MTDTIYLTMCAVVSIPLKCLWKIEIQGCGSQPLPIKCRRCAPHGAPRTMKLGLPHVHNTPEKQSRHFWQDGCVGHTQEPLSALLSPIELGQVTMFVWDNTNTTASDDTEPPQCLDLVLCSGTSPSPTARLWSNLSCHETSGSPTSHC